MTKRTITLSDRAPVTITEEDWPTIADASDDWFDNEHKVQANRTSDWLIRVRQHKDGRAIVYATYKFDSNYQKETSRQVRHGQLLDAGADIVAAIRTVTERMEDMDAEHHGDDDTRWAQLADDCIADLPAEEM